MNNDTDGTAPSVSGITEDLSLFNYKLNDLDRMSGLLFGAGLGVLFHQANLTEESITLEASGGTLEENTRINYTIAQELIEMSRFNLLAGLISFYTTTERLKQIEKIFEERHTLSSEERLAGREMVTMANTLSVSAFILAMNGYEKIAAGILHQQAETPPP